VTTSLKVLDLFSGAGGLSLGLSQAGLDVIGAVDNDAASLQTYAENLGSHCKALDLAAAGPSSISRVFDVDRGEVDIIAGGPPCQGFSLQRRGTRADSRNQLVLSFIEVVEHFLPSMFIMENVGALRSKNGLPYLNELRLRAEAVGYQLEIQTLNAADFGVSQIRERAFVVGIQSAAISTPFRFPTPKLDSTCWRTVRDAIGDLPSPPPDGSEHSDYTSHFREGRLSRLNIERITHVPPGGGRLDIPPHLQLRCHKENPTHRHLDVYGRLDWDRPSGTLTARFDSFTRGRFAHPEEHRTITLREGARLQTFPDDFRFVGSREDVARQIGNAVPPVLAHQIGLAMREALGNSPESYTDAARRPNVKTPYLLAG
jgi:DNA (cytosine-5)-methyltransferase 1